MESTEIQQEKNRLQNISKANLSRELSICYHKIIEYSVKSTEIAMLNLKALADHHELLQMSWFTFDLLEIMRKYLMSLEGSERTPILKLLLQHSSLGGMEHPGTIELLVNDEHSAIPMILMGYIASNRGRDAKSIELLLKWFRKGVILSLKFNQAFCKLLLSVTDQTSVQLSMELLESDLSLENDILLPAKLFYYITEKKYQLYTESLSKSTLSSIKGVLFSPFVDTHDLPNFLKVLQKGCSNTTVRDNHLLARLGIIRFLQDRSKKENFALYRESIEYLERIYISDLVKSHSQLKPFLFGEFTNCCIVELGNIRETELAQLLISIAETITSSDLYLKPTGLNGMIESDILNRKVHSVLFKSMGSTCSALQKGISLLLGKKYYNDIIIIPKLLFDLAENFPVYCTEDLIHLDIKSGDGYMADYWTFLKTVLFSMLMIIDPISFTLQSMKIPSNDEHIQKMVSLVTECISIYYVLNFITVRYGLGGLPMLESQISSLSAYYSRLYRSKESLDFVFRNTFIECRPFISNSTSVQRDFLNVVNDIYLLNLSKNFMGLYSDGFIEEILLPICQNYIVLTIPTTTVQPLDRIKIDARVISHLIYIKLFEYSTVHQKLINSISAPYVNLLLENTICVDVELVKETFQGLMNGLCDFSPAKDRIFLGSRFLKSSESTIPSSPHEKDRIEVISRKVTEDMVLGWAKNAEIIAWKCIQILSDKIRNSLNDSVRVSMLIILFEQINTISAYHLHDLLQIIKEFLLGTSFKESDESILWKALYDVVSEEKKVDYERRYTCVVWYLELISTRKTSKQADTTSFTPAKL